MYTPYNFDMYNKQIDPHMIQLTIGITLLPSFAAISEVAFSFAFFVKTFDAVEAPSPGSPSVALFNLNVPENVVSILYL